MSCRVKFLGFRLRILGWRRRTFFRDSLDSLRCLAPKLGRCFGLAGGGLDPSRSLRYRFAGILFRDHFKFVHRSTNGFGREGLPCLPGFRHRCGGNRNRRLWQRKRWRDGRFRSGRKSNRAVLVRRDRSAGGLTGDSCGKGCISLLHLVLERNRSFFLAHGNRNRRPTWCLRNRRISRPYCHRYRLCDGLWRNLVSRMLRWEFVPRTYNRQRAGARVQPGNRGHQIGVAGSGQAGCFCRRFAEFLPGRIGFLFGLLFQLRLKLLLERLIDNRHCGCRNLRR